MAFILFLLEICIGYYFLPQFVALFTVFSSLLELKDLWSLFVAWLTDWVSEWVIDRLVDIMIVRSTDWLIDRTLGWVSDSFIHALDHWLIDWFCILILILCSPGTTTDEEPPYGDNPGAKQYCLQYPAHPATNSRSPAPRTGPKHHWCLVRYWEESTPLGTGHYKVVQPVLTVAHGPLHHQACEVMRLDGLDHPGGGLRTKTTQRLRDGIGAGFTLILDAAAGTISIYNGSKLSLFVSSPYLDSQYGGEAAESSVAGRRPVKLLPGWICVAFDLDWSPPAGGHAPTPLASRYVDSIQVSFGKGWGHGYKRQLITNCNCWTEISLDNIHRRWLFSLHISSHFFTFFSKEMISKQKNDFTSFCFSFSKKI